MSTRGLRVGLGLPLAIVLAACSSSTGEAGRSPSPSSAASASPTAGAKAAASAQVALWPETDRSVAPTTFPIWRGSAEGTTSHFAAAVLGWPNPVVHAIHSRFHVEQGVQTFAVSPRTGARAVEIHAARVFDRQHWSVTDMWGFGAQEPPASLAITRTNGDVRLGYWNNSATAKLLVTYGNHQLERTSSSSAHWTFPVTFPIDVNGAIIIMFKSRTGQVTTGWGTALTAGPIAAG